MSSAERATHCSLGSPHCTACENAQLSITKAHKFKDFADLIIILTMHSNYNASALKLLSFFSLPSISSTSSAVCVIPGSFEEKHERLQCCPMSNTSTTLLLQTADILYTKMYWDVSCLKSFFFYGTIQQDKLAILAHYYFVFLERDTEGGTSGFIPTPASVILRLPDNTNAKMVPGICIKGRTN